jgi:hypothetical protein
MRYVSVTVRLAASGLVAIIAVSLLPPFWTYSSLAAVGVALAWTVLSASRAKRLLTTPTGRRLLAVSLKRRELQRDAFGDLIRPNI